MSARAELLTTKQKALGKRSRIGVRLPKIHLPRREPGSTGQSGLGPPRFVPPRQKEEWLGPGRADHGREPCHIRLRETRS